MKILYITHATDLAGANRSMLQMIKELRDNHDVEPFIVFPLIEKDLKHNIMDECLKNNIPFLQHRMTNFKRHEGFNLIEILYFIFVQAFVVLDLFFFFKRKNFDFIHTNSSVNDTGAYLSMLLGIPHVWHLREFGKEDFGLVSCLGTNYEKWIYKKCVYVIAISDVIKEHFSKVFEKKKIMRIYNGVVRKSVEYSSKHQSYMVNLCMVGRVEQNKNQFEALQAIEMLKNKGIKNFHLTIVGAENPEYKKQLVDYASAKDLIDYVSFLGSINNVPEILSNMDIGLMLSSNEAFGRVTIEYMLQNLLVIASDRGANPELIRNGENGYLYKLGDPEDLSNRIEKVIQDRELLKAIATSGKSYAERYFLSTVNSNNVYQLYLKIFNRNTNSIDKID